MPRVAAGAVAASPAPCRTPRSRSAASTSSAANTGAARQAETLLTEAPHVSRESEYESVVSFVARRWAHEANTSLFVCGGCGCGKTSTVKRALRAMSARVLPCDATSRSLVKQSTLEERGWQTTTEARISDHSTPVCTPRTSGQMSTEATSDGCGLTPASSVMSSPDLRARSSSGHSLAAALESRLRLSSPESGRPSASSDDSSAGRSRNKRGRDDSDGAFSVSADVNAKRHCRTSELAESAASYSLTYFATRYPEVFATARQVGTGKSASAAASTRQLFAHYVNCADVSGAHLVDAVCESIKATCTRTDIATCDLLQLLASVGKSATQRSRGSAGGLQAFSPTAAAATRRRAVAPALHVVALDEVEYIRGGGAKTLAQLAELSFEHPGQLALIFISNQRAFVHVPQMMLEALLFQPYTEAQLRGIGADATTAELQRCEEQYCASTGAGPGRGSKARKTGAKTSAAASAPLRAADVDIKPRLYDYIARKALLEFSGDVRQVIAMCHRVVSVAWQEVTEARRIAAAASAPRTTTSARTAAASSGRHASTAAAAAAAAATTTPTTPDLSTKLEAAVQSFSLSKVRTTAAAATTDAASPASGVSSTRSSGAAAAVTNSSSSLPPPPPPPRPSQQQQQQPSPAVGAGSGVMTLAKTVRVLQTNQVESDIDKHVGTLPEQTLYVLSCIVVLTLRRQEERMYASTSVGGRMGSSRVAGAGLTAAQRAAPTLSLKMQEVHHLYTRLMSELHFPAMRADGFQLQVGCLADFGVLTRPQQRGTDVVFSLNGTWTLPAMQAALVRRGEAIKQDRVAAGAGAMMENRFEEVLRELGKLVK